jgi:hypothetical protein
LFLFFVFLVCFLFVFISFIITFLKESKCFCFDGNVNSGTSCIATPCGYNNELICATDGSNYATFYYRLNAGKIGIV